MRGGIPRARIVLEEQVGRAGAQLRLGAGSGPTKK